MNDRRITQQMFDEQRERENEMRSRKHNPHNFYFICASPLVKIYLPEWHERLELNPELMHEAEDFEFSVSTGTRGFRIEFNKPQLMIGYDSKENRDIFDWLTGGPSGRECQETDCYGIVPFNPQLDMAGTFDQLQRLETILNGGEGKKAEKAKRDYEKTKADAAKRMKEERDRVVLASKTRIVRAMKFNHNALVKQWAINEEMKLGKHRPSNTEMFGMHALDKEIQAAAERGAALKHRVNETMSRTAVV